MSVKVFQTNKAGKIEFTRCELEKLLNETYNEGYRDGENHAKNSYWTWTSPSIPIERYPTITYCNSTDPIDGLIADKTTINGAVNTAMDAMLNGKFDLLNRSNVETSKITVNNPFSDLEKELTTL